MPTKTHKSWLTAGIKYVQMFLTLLHYTGPNYIQFALSTEGAQMCKLSQESIIENIRKVVLNLLFYTIYEHFIFNMLISECEKVLSASLFNSTLKPYCFYPSMYFITEYSIKTRDLHCYIIRLHVSSHYA